MTKQTPGVKALLKELDLAKKQLKAEYDRSLRAVEEAIKQLSSAKLDVSDHVKTTRENRGPGRPNKGAVDLKGMVKKLRGKGKRGRPVGSKSGYNVNLTQTIQDLVANKGRFLHSREIVDLLIRKFPQEDRAEFAKKVSVLLASLKKQGRLTTFKAGGYRKNMYWGVKEWMKDGKIAKGREFSTK